MCQDIKHTIRRRGGWSMQSLVTLFHRQYQLNSAHLFCVWIASKLNSEQLELVCIRDPSLYKLDVTEHGVAVTH